MYEGLMAKGLPSQGALKGVGLHGVPCLCTTTQSVFIARSPGYTKYTHIRIRRPLLARGQKAVGANQLCLPLPCYSPLGGPKPTLTRLYPCLPDLTRPYPRLPTLIRPYQIASPKPRSLPNEPVNRTVISFSSRGSSFLSFRSPEMVRDAHKMAPI